MTEPEGDSQAISVAELLARNGQRVGAGGGGRRRRGVKGGISVAELTGEFPAVRNGRAGESDESGEPAEQAATPATPATPAVAQTAAPDATALFTLSDADAQDDADAGAAAKATPANSVKPAPVKPVPVKPAVVKPAVVKPAVVKPALVKQAPVKPAPVKSAPVDDAPTVVAPAVRDAGPTGRDTNSGWRSVTSPTVTEPSPQPEPRLLSGQTLAGDLMRQGNDRTETGRDTDPEADLEDLENFEDPENPENFDDLDGVDDLDDEPEVSGAKQWAVLLGQGAVALVAGALMFKGFEKLWDMLPMVALVLAVLVIVGLVAMVRILRRTDDITSLVIAVVAGVFVTLGPLAFLLGTS